MNDNSFKFFGWVVLLIGVIVCVKFWLAPALTEQNTNSIQVKLMDRYGDNFKDVTFEEHWGQSLCFDATRYTFRLELKDKTVLNGTACCMNGDCELR